MAYQSFAAVYDQLMGDQPYEQWADYVTSRVSAGAQVLDLGAGSARLGLQLSERGYEYTGLDLSEEMLTIASRLQQERNCHFPLIQGDMRDLSDFGTYDAVLSFCDSLCYLPEKEDLLLVFKQVYEHLSDEGVFLFDVHSTYQMEDFDGFSYHDETEEFALLWESFAGESQWSVEHYLTIFSQTADGNFKRFRELHKERTYPETVYRELLSVAGFNSVQVTADFGSDVEPESRRLFFEVRK